MPLIDHLTRKKSAILKRWLDVIFESYPPETAVFLKKEKNHFDNPVGHRIAEGLAGLYDSFIRELEKDKVLNYLDEIIRIRALQDFSPSQALAFIFLLKNVIREELANPILAEKLGAEVLEFESRIDGLALLAFDVYCKRREKIYEVRADEKKGRVNLLLRKAGITDESL
jgi:hypothetical protein